MNNFHNMNSTIATEELNRNLIFHLATIKLCTLYLNIYFNISSIPRKDKFWIFFIGDDF